MIHVEIISDDGQEEKDRDAADDKGIPNIITAETPSTMVKQCITLILPPTSR